MGKHLSNSQTDAIPELFTLYLENDLSETEAVKKIADSLMKTKERIRQILRKAKVFDNVQNLEKFNKNEQAEILNDEDILELDAPIVSEVKETANKDSDFIKQLEEISKRVEKMPEWKKEGWAILDDPYVELGMPCGIRPANVPETSSDYEIAPNPQTFIKGESILYDAQGNVKQKWVKTDNKKDYEFARQMAETLAEDLPQIVTTKSKHNYNEDILVAIPFGDPHLGQHSWFEETGADFDLKIAERDLCGAVDRLVNSTPPSAECLIANLGDFFHADNMDAQTWRSKHALDVDSRWAKVLRVGVKAMRYCIESAAKRHKKVTVINAIGNHDDHSSMFLTVALSHIYENDTRINIIDSPTSIHYYRFGKVLVAVTHGHNIKMANLPLVVATERPKEWGETVYRYGFTGHIHHDSKKEFNGMLVESFRTLSARDAWAASKGYNSGRDMKAIALHRNFGEVERHTVSVEMMAISK